MKKMLKMLPAFCLLLQTTIMHAEDIQSSKSIQFENQREEIFDLENFLKKTEYTEEEVKDTCTRKIPYEEKVCKDVTKYKKECTTVPAHEECKDVNHPICHNETHMEQECTDRTRTVCSTHSVPRCHTETKYETQCTDGSPTQQCRTVTEPVCHSETRYRDECRTVPGEQQCKVVIRYHEECNNVPGGRQCRTVPGDIRCRVINGENKCEKIPPHEECTDAPTRRECRQKPYEERECSTGPSRQECRQVPYQDQVCENRSRQECTTIPGRQECRQVPRQEQVCTYESEQQCHEVPTGEQDCRQVPKTEEVCKDHYEKVCKNVPAKEECKKVPYKENVCKMVTKYKDEQYECTKTVQVPHEVVVAHHKAHVQMNFDAKAKEAESRFTMELNEEGELVLGARDSGEANLLIFAKKEIKKETSGKENNLNAIFNIALYDVNESFRFMKTGIKEIELKPKKMEFVLDGKADFRKAAVDLQISKRGKSRFDKHNIPGTEFKAEFDGEKTHVEVDLEKIGAPMFGGLIHREHTVIIRIKFDFSNLGSNVLNPNQQFVLEKSADVTVKY